MKTWIVMAALLAFCGCDDDDDSEDGNAGGTGGAVGGAGGATGGAGGTTGGAGGEATDMGVTGGTGGEVTPDAGAPDLGPPPETCAAGGYTDCFSNYDCADAERCQALDGDGFVVCCVPGERGELQAGEDCSAVDGQQACASSLCFETDAGDWCSDQCEGPEDCPAMFPNCAPIAFAGEGNWCQPD